MGLNQEERDAKIEELQATVANATAVLDSLGIGTGNDVKMDATSPDGGPASHAHKFLKATLTSTKAVMVTGADGKQTEALIATSDFDPDIHTEVKAKRAAISMDPTPAAEPAPEFSDEDRSTLLVLTVEKLKAMPEVEFMDTVPTTKSDLVDAILEVREDYAE